MSVVNQAPPPPWLKPVYLGPEEPPIPLITSMVGHFPREARYDATITPEVIVYVQCGGERRTFLSTGWKRIR